MIGLFVQQTYNEKPFYDFRLPTKYNATIVLYFATLIEDIGCFGLTELGFGNNAVEMQTTAIYNKEDDTITINSPTELSHKYWITNGALHAQHCVVFAQLKVGEEWHGVHAILCQVRDGVAGPTLPGLRLSHVRSILEVIFFR